MCTICILHFAHLSYYAWVKQGPRAKYNAACAVAGMQNPLLMNIWSPASLVMENVTRKYCLCRSTACATCLLNNIFRRKKDNTWLCENY